MHLRFAAALALDSDPTPKEEVAGLSRLPGLSLPRENSEGPEPRARFERAPSPNLDQRAGLEPA